MKVARLCHLVLPLFLAAPTLGRFREAASAGVPRRSHPLRRQAGAMGVRLSVPEDGLSQRSNRPINPRVTAPAKPSRPVQTTPTPAPKGPTLGIPISRAKPVRHRRVSALPPRKMTHPKGGVRSGAPLAFLWSGIDVTRALSVGRSKHWSSARAIAASLSSAACMETNRKASG